MSGPSAEDLRARIVGRLKWACEHFQDDPECAELTAAGLEEFFQVDLAAKDAEIARLAEENTTLVGQLADHRATLKRLTDLTSQYADRAIENGQRAERAEAEVERLKAERAGWRSMAGVAEVEAERDRLREELRLARFDKERAEATVARLRVLRDDYWRLPGCSEIGDDLDAALDQAPAAEQDGGA